jgi:hypothetical protein
MTLLVLGWVQNAGIGVKPRRNDVADPTPEVADPSRDPVADRHIADRLEVLETHSVIVPGRSQPKAGYEQEVTRADGP